MRVPYHAGTNREGRCRIVRFAGHETMPYFPGQWFSKRDKATENGLTEASMLALLKLWGSLTTLKKDHETFRNAFNEFMSDASEGVHSTVANIEFFHQCSDSVRARTRSGEDTIHTTVDNDSMFLDTELDAVLSTADITAHNAEPFNDLLTEDVILTAIDRPFSGRAKRFAQKALLIEENSGVPKRLAQFDSVDACKVDLVKPPRTAV
ncbi:hypothetical protein H4582DRAFT_1455846 [Lactarius indigo]|nr:hypothetical protein H4582DRAFT_1455846 [Lactarius indigo]